MILYLKAIALKKYKAPSSYGIIARIVIIRSAMFIIKFFFSYLTTCYTGLNFTIMSSSRKRGSRKSTYIMTYYVYILCSQKNGTLYVGITNDLDHRLYEHKQELIKGFTEKYHVDKLVYMESYQDIIDLGK